MERSILWLDEITNDQLSLVGGKALNLARLRRAGFDVPNGFVLTTGVHRMAMGTGGQGGVPREASENLLSCFQKLDSAAVAVRSSAACEDSATASFAGQGQSVLHVRTADELMEAVTAVWNSLQQPRAQNYVRKMGMAGSDPTVAVVVQEMVEATSSGVLFTSHPVTGADDEIVINAAWGLGEPIVSGEITPDEIVVDKATGKAKRAVVGRKEKMLSRDGLQPTAADQAAALCLDEKQIRQLSEIGRRIEKEFGAAQDIEWAWGERLCIVQTRPLTTRPRTTQAEGVWREEIERLRSVPGSRHKVWVATGMAEILPCPTPLSWEVASRMMSGAEGYGLAQRRLGYDPAPGTILERIAGHVYVDLDGEIRLFFRRAPIGYSLKEVRENPRRATMPRQTFSWRKLRPSILWEGPLLIGRVIRLARRVRRLRRDFRPHFENRFLPDFEECIRSERQRDRETLSTVQLIEVFENRLDRFLHHTSPTFLTGSILAAMSYREIEDLLIDRLGREGAELAQALTAGLTPNPLLEMHRALCRLARGVLSEEEFLTRFGHRGSSEFELAVPRWREDRTALTQNVEQLRRSALSDDASSAKGESVRRDAEARLDRLEKKWGRVAREMVRSRLRAARQLYPLREQAKDFLMMHYELLRIPLREIDVRLDLRGGIFYLYCRELRSAVDDPDSVRPLIEERRRRHELYQQLHLPQVILGESLSDLEGTPEGRMGKELQGMGVSPGVARGRARVVRTASELAAVEEGEILVVTALDPTWTSALAQAAGLIAERGAILSHGAIVAREFALPAVVNVDGAAQRLRNGQQLHVDGSRGSVVCIE